MCERHWWVISIVCNLDLQVTADTRDLSIGLDGAAGKVKSFGQRVKEAEKGSAGDRAQTYARLYEQEQKTYAQSYAGYKTRLNDQLKAAKDYEKEQSKLRKEAEREQERKATEAKRHAESTAASMGTMVTQAVAGITSGSLSGVTSGLSGIATTAAGMIGGPIAGAAAGAISAVAGAVASGVESIASRVTGAVAGLERLGMASRQIGVASTTLAALQRGGEIAGIGVDAVSSSMAALVKNLNEAGMGAGPSLLALRQLSLRGKEMAALGADQQILKISKAFERVGNAGDRMRLAQGLGVTELMPLIEQGEAGIKRLIEEGKGLGLGEGTKAAQEASRAWRDFQSAAGSVWNSFASASLPVLTDVAKGFAVVGNQVGRFVAANRDLIRVTFDVGLTIGKVMFDVGAAITSAVTGWGTLTAAVGASGLTWNTVKAGILTGLFAVEYTIDRWPEVWGNVVDRIKLKFVTLANDIANIFTTVIPNAIKGQGISFERADTELEQRLKQRLEARGKSFEEFVRGKMDALNAKGPEDVKGKNDGPIQGVARKTAAMEFGSKEAFSTIYGTQDAQAKALEVANKQLNENKAMRKALEKLVAKQLGIKVKKVKL